MIQTGASKKRLKGISTNPSNIIEQGTTRVEDTDNTAAQQASGNEASANKNQKSSTTLLGGVHENVFETIPTLRKHMRMSLYRTPCIIGAITLLLIILFFVLGMKV